MSRPPVIVRTFPKLVSTLDALRGRRNATIALVPTMGALHDGHLALVAKGHELADKVVVSIFVNPTQFAPTEDFGAYPRTFASDREKLTKAGCDVIWNPTPAMMYPDGFASRVYTEGPATAGLEDRFRPHFFGGVATVVAKLFTQVRPEIAVFGQKDYQQLLVVTQMARDLDLRVKVVGLPTVREADGLAMSSRNVYLSIEDRARAPVLHRALMAARKRIRAGDEIAVAVREAAKTIAVAGFVIDYVEARHGQTLAPISARSEGPIRLLVAAKLGATRLIDNISV